MSKYEYFVNMKTYGFLILLLYIQLIFCEINTNITDDLYPVCPVELVRRKRALTEYTRWRANIETTNEFLVKVLDEDLTTSHTIPIAVNILPATKFREQIIIGGVNVPSPTTIMSTTSDPKDYTRFIMPTTLPARDTNHHINIAPITAVTVHNTIIHPLQPQGYHSQRDDSPPASPQFIARTPTLVARQFAPIEQVAFSRRNSFTTLTLPSATTFYTVTSPNRTPLEEIITLPDRTKSNFNLLNFKPFEETVTPDYTVPSNYILPERTTEFEFSSAIGIEEFESTSNKLSQDNRRREESKKVHKNSEMSYNMMFYNDDELFVSKKEQDGIDLDYDKKVPDGSELTEQSNEDEEKKNRTDVGQEIESDISEYENKTGDIISNDISSEPLIDMEMIKTVKPKLRERRRPICNLLKLRELNFNAPQTLPEIVRQLKAWAESSPVAKWIDITHGNYTTMENPIHMMIVDDPSSGQIVTAKQTVMVVAGIQGRDHHAVAAAMYVLYQLIERTESHADLLTKYRFWIIPVFNPDGYDYSMTFPQKREWTKNLRQDWDSCKGRESCKYCESHGLRCTIQPCYGVNLDRNFEYQWIPAEELQAEHPCGALYAGPRQLSEAETRALTSFLHDQRTPLFTFIAFKEGDVLGIMYPYSHTKKRRALDHLYRQRASQAAAAAYSISNRPYVYGQTSEFLPLYAGGIEDWVDGHLGIDNTYTIMMFRPSDSYNTKLITERVVHETYAAMDTLLLQSLEALGLPPAVKITARASARAFRPQRLFYIFTFYSLICFND